LAVEPYPSEKYDSSQLGWLYIPNILWTNKKMFQTTNQQI
jgi:hypothetical protein